MRCLIRVLTYKSKGVLSQQDREFEGEQLTIGRGAGQDVYLPDLRVALEHAKVTASGVAQFLIQSKVPSGIRHNEDRVQSALLAVGDRVRIGDYQITVAPPEAGYELVLIVEQTRRAGGKEQALISRPEKAPRFGVRAWSWTLFLLILIAFLVLPITGFIWPPMRAVLRTWLSAGSDSAWDSGTLSRGHQYFSSDCNTCHQFAFVSVRNSACLKCHQDQPHHVELNRFNLVSLNEKRCASCHKEHSGPDAVILSDQDLCLDCHRHIKAIASDSKLLDIGGGFDDGHPQFRATLVTNINGKDQSKRLSINLGKEMKERSNLFFPHDTHLDPQGQLGPEGKIILSCASCHVPEPGGRRMAPIRFESHCHGCHKLTFEADEPQREVPHGNTRLALNSLTGYYASRALKGDYWELGMPQVIRRRPGQKLTVPEMQEVLAWASNTAEDVGKELLEFRACAICHTVQMQGPELSTWDIAPVRIAQAWYPKAYFDHSKHKTMACTDCHDAARSESSEDVLVKGIQTCRECHASPGTENKIASTCISCHGFHTAREYTFDGKRRKLSDKKIPHLRG
jgi:predicted CXXCH cytochrome family protein